MRPVVVGAGIGGPAATPTALRAEGHEVAVVMRARRFAGPGR